MRRVFGVYKNKRDLEEAMGGLIHLASTCFVAVALSLEREGAEYEEYEAALVVTSRNIIGGVLCTSADVFVEHRVFPLGEDWFSRGNAIREAMDWLFEGREEAPEGFVVRVYPATDDRRVAAWLTSEWWAQEAEA